MKSTKLSLNERLLATGTLEHDNTAARHKNAEKEARSMMISSNQSLVSTFAKHYLHRGLSFADLVKEGNLGLMRAIGSFDPGRGVHFTTYASWWILQSIEEAVANHCSSIPASRSDVLLSYSSIRKVLGLDPITASRSLKAKKSQTHH